ncbi:MAG TPA: hypothetical protein VF335_09165 [Chitinivibrionales bacterium]
MKTLVRRVLWAIFGFYAYSFAASAGLDTMPSTINGKPGKIIDSTAQLKPKNVAAADTVKTGTPADSTKVLPRDTSKVKSAASEAAALPPPEDTLYHFWNRSYWGIGAGWGLGSFPLFDQWQRGLPDSATDLVGKNAQTPRFTITQAVDAYYIVWPLILSYTPFPGERNSLTLESSWYFLFSGKSFIATLKNDSLPAQSVSWSQSCAAYFFTLGLSYRRAIPEEYFKVEGVKQTAVILGLSVTPLLRVTKSSSFSSTDIADSTKTALMAHSDNRVWNGVGCSWKLGISTLKKLSSRSGLQMDLVYIGRFNGLFSRAMQWRDINPTSDTPNEKVSFMSSTFEINISLLSGKRPTPAAKR